MTVKRFLLYTTGCSLGGVIGGVVRLTSQILALESTIAMGILDRHTFNEAGMGIYYLGGLMSIIVGLIAGMMQVAWALRTPAGAGAVLLNILSGIFGLFVGTFAGVWVAFFLSTRHFSWEGVPPAMLITIPLFSILAMYLFTLPLRRKNDLIVNTSQDATV